MLLLACAAACLTGMVRRAAPSLNTLQHLDTAAMFRYGRTPAVPVVCVSDSTGRATHPKARHSRSDQSGVDKRAWPVNTLSHAFELDMLCEHDWLALQALLRLKALQHPWLVQEQPF